MEYKYIDLGSFPRRAHFDYFRSFAYPYVGYTVKVDITDFVRRQKEHGAPFFLSFCYCAERAANSVAEFRQRIRGDGIVEYDWCPSSYTLALDNGTYCYCMLDSRMPFSEFLPEAQERQAEAMSSESLDDGDDAESLLFISSNPWLSYDAFVQPVPYPADSNPRISIGKYYTDGGRVLFPVTVLCNHALVDGKHIAEFFSALDMELSSVF